MRNGFVTGAPPAEPKRPWTAGYAIAALLVALALAGLAMWISAGRSGAENARTLVSASYARRIATTELLTRLEAAESAQRGYVITRNPAFLAPYAPARVELLRRLSRLEHSYLGNPDQTTRLLSFKAVISTKFDEMTDVIQRLNHGDPSGASNRVADSQGRLLMQQAYAIASEMIATEDRTLAADLASAHRQSAHTDRILWLLVALVAATLLLAIGLSFRARLTRYATETQAHEALLRLRAVFASTSEAMLILNPSGTVEDVNAAATRLLGYETAALERKDVSTIVDIADGEGSFEQRVGIVDGKLERTTRLDRIGRHKDGRQIPVDVALGVMPLADGIHVVALLRDVSDRTEANRLKEEFISTVSHELRTPLTSVVGALGLLRGGAVGDLTDPARRLIEIAENNARRLIRLINDILDIDRVGSGQTPVEAMRLDLRKVAAQGADDGLGLADQRSVKLTLDMPNEPVWISGDEQRLLQVIGNLLSNAIRFSPGGGTVTLSLFCKDRRVMLCVTDQGPGVAPEFRERIFGRFAQSDAGAAISGGSGLGLAISREIIKAHGGEIWFEDVADGGARFCIALPSMNQPAPLVSGERPVILMCEDDVNTAEILATMIEAKGYQVDRCGTALEAQVRARAGIYAGIILDLSLPDANGLTVVKAIRAMPETRSVPIVIVSGLARDNAQDAEAHALEVIDWIDKPVDHDRLLRALDVAINRSPSGRPVLLHIDDDPDMLEVTALALVGKGRMLRATSVAEAREVFASSTPDVVILDLNLPDGSGLDLLPDLLTADGTAVPTIIYSASELSPELGRRFDAVLVKSRRSMLALSDTIDRVLAKRQGERGNDE